MRRLPGDATAHLRAVTKRAAEQAHIKRAWQLFRSLLDRKIVEFIEPRSGASGRAPPEIRFRNMRRSAESPLQKIRVNIELQEDFSMDQALSCICSTQFRWWIRNSRITRSSC